MKRKITLSTALTLILLTAAVTVSVTMLLAMRYFNRQVQSVSQRQAMYTHINDVDKKVRTYYKDLDEETLRQKITEGYIKGIGDPYAQYFTNAGYTAETLRLSGQANNVGVEVWENAQGQIVVSRIAADSAAGKAGVKVGDVITALDGTEAASMSRAEIQKKLDSAGQILIRIDRDGTESAFDLSAYKYTIRSVQDSTQGEIGILKITGFYQNTPDQFRAKVAAFQEKGVTGFIFDLRGNTGGSPEAVQKMLSYVMPLGVYGTITDVEKKTTNLSSNVNNGLSTPTVVLVDKDTAGEAEFFAGVLQEFGLVTVIGTTTAGEAKYQEYFTLESDGSAIKLSVGEYGLLKGGSWQGKGIEPDVESVLSEEESAVAPLLTTEKDPQMQAAFQQFNKHTAPVVTGTTAATTAATAATTAVSSAATPPTATTAASSAATPPTATTAAP